MSINQYTGTMLEKMHQKQKLELKYIKKHHIYNHQLYSTTIDMHNGKQWIREIIV